MGRKLQTIYEYFSDYSEKQIDDMMCKLSIYDKSLIISRFGKDLHNPSPQEDWSRENSVKYYGSVVPKMKKILSQNFAPAELTDTESETVGLNQEPKTEEIEETDVSQLLQLLKTKNNREICEFLNISPNQLYDELLKLKNKGTQYIRKYYSDGFIKYKDVSAPSTLIKYKCIEQEKTIITDINEDDMKFLLISDLHFGNELERIDLVNRAYEYCIKNGINIILCGGDLIDGAFTKGTQKISDLYEQVEYFMKNYPYDKNILTFSVAGDHDVSVLTKASLDIMEICNNFRHDIVIVGYNNAKINLKNDGIQLFHFNKDFSCKRTSPIILNGHLHKYSTEINNNSLNIPLPTLSNIVQPMPTALELDVYFYKGYIETAIIKQLYFGDKDIVLGESKFDLLSGRNINYGQIANEENYKQNTEQNFDKEKVLKKTNLPSSQIEKFYKRYGR